MNRVNNWVAGALLAATGLGVPAQAQDRCWTGREARAAQVRDMQTMLMVAALRCRAAHIDISADYDMFVVAQGAALDAANLAIKRHFAAQGGSQADYDRFATGLANAFGGETTNEASCAEAAKLAHDGAAAAPAQLEQVALGRVFPAALPGGTCPAPAATAIAAAAPSPAPLPPVVALAAPPPVVAPVSLPTDVVAALTVLAHYQNARQPRPSATQTAMATGAP